MKHTITLDRGDLLCAIEDYLSKQGYTPQKQSYYPWAQFKLGKVEIGTQREPESIETVIGVECTLQN